MNTAVDRMLAIGRKPWMRRHRAPTFVFADLAGYTALTEAQGDHAAAELARAFRRAMRALARKHGGWQVKSMGDGVMIWTPERPPQSSSPPTRSRRSEPPLSYCPCVSASIPAPR